MTALASETPVKKTTKGGKPEHDFVVADLSLADWGRKEIAIAEHEMPGLMAIRRSTPRRSRSRARASPAACT